jgi:hypothetical protein
METISQANQIERMEIIAAATGASDYDQIREELFLQLDSQYGKGKWEFTPLSKKQVKQFTDWISREED